MRKQITNEELNNIIKNAINEELDGATDYQLPEGRDISIELKSLKTRAKFVDFGKLEPGSKLASIEFKKLLLNAEKYNELFDKIKLVICGKVKNIKDIEFTLKTNNFQLSNDDEQVFLLFEKVFKDFADDDESNAAFEANSALGDNIDLIGTEVNEKIAKFGMSINLQFIQQHIIVTLNTPFDFAEYNKEIDKYMR
jgi:hypothetical protein